MWQTKVSIVPVVVGALGIVKQGQADIVKSLPGMHMIGYLVEGRACIPVGHEA